MPDAKNEGRKLKITIRTSFSVSAILRDLFMGVIIVWLLCPFQFFFSNWYIYGILWGAWIVLSIMADSKSFTSMIMSKYSLIAFLWPVTIFVLSLFNWADFSLYQFTITFVVFAFVYYAEGNHYKSLRFFVFIFLVYTSMIAVYSIEQLSINPEISRILASSDKNMTIEFANPFMANFSTINGITLVALFLVFYCKETSKKLLRLISIFLLVLFLYLMMSAQYAIALFLFVIFSLYILFVFSKNQKNDTIKLLIICVCVLIAIPLISNLLMRIADIVPPGYIERRLKSIGTMLGGGGIRQGSDLQKRLTLYELSINTFFSNFFFGVGGKIYGANGLAGGHSTILDNFAYYGVFFGSQFVWYLVSTFKNGSKYFINDYYRMYKLIFITYFIECLLNTSYNEELLLIIFFIVPSFIFLFQRENYINLEGPVER